MYYKYIPKCHKSQEDRVLIHEKPDFMDIQTAGEYESCFFLTFVMDICACMKKLIVFLLCFAGYLLVSSYDSNPADLIDRMIEKNKTLSLIHI